MTNVGTVTEAHCSADSGLPVMPFATTVPSYASVCASASMAGHMGMSRIGATNAGGRPTALVMKNSTAAPRRPVDTSSVSRST